MSKRGILFIDTGSLSNEALKLLQEGFPKLDLTPKAVRERYPDLRAQFDKRSRVGVDFIDEAGDKKRIKRDVEEYIGKQLAARFPGWSSSKRRAMAKQGAMDVMRERERLARENEQK